MQGYMYYICSMVSVPVCLVYNSVIAERLSARHIIRQYDLNERVCLYVSHALECNILLTSFTYFSNHVAYDARMRIRLLNRRPLPTPRV